VGEVGGEIVFGFPFRPSRARFCWGFIAPCCVTEFGNLVRVFAGALFCVCLGFHCPIYDSVLSDNGVIFRMVLFVLFLGFLPGPTKLVGVTGLQMLQ
jgi:hypothetical protein